MGYKKVVTGLALALGAVAAPMDTQANSETNAEPKVTAAEKAKLSPAKKRVSTKRAFIPAWVPVTEEYGARVLRLPLYYDMSEEDTERVVKKIGDFYG